MMKSPYLLYRARRINVFYILTFREAARETDMDILRDQLNATQTYNPMALNSNRGGMMRYLALKKLFNDIE